MTDYRAMCAELISNLQLILGYFESDECGTSDSEELIARARALLAESKPESPTDEDLEQLVFDNHRIAISFACDSKEEAQVMISGYVKFARAVLAKWGHQ